MELSASVWERRGRKQIFAESEKKPSYSRTVRLLPLIFQEKESEKL
jgi:hypothetical protein